MKKYISILLQLITFAMQVNAMPAKRIPHTVKLEDGTTITAYTRGDETYHFLATEDGTPVLKVSDGIYRIAPELKESVYATWTQRSQARNMKRFAKAQKNIVQNGKHKSAFGYPTSYKGTKRGIVILVNFSDSKMKAANTNEAFTNQFNQVGYNKNGHIGSVHDYFLDVSYGMFDIEFDVFGPVTVSKSYSYYGQNDDEGEDKYPATMCIEAAKLANSTYDIDWSNYDWDGDGEVDQVCFIYAGYGENASDDTNLIWPHEWDLESAKASGDGAGPLSLGKVKINTYSVSCELEGSSGSTVSGIGTAVHEFSHCLGLPDLYDTSYSGGFGMNAWDIMDQGSYNGPTGWGEVPAGYSAYERWFAGWLDFTELNEPCYVKDMPSLADSAFAYILYNDGNKNEYFILENRQSDGFFKYVGDGSNCHGMLVTHVDYDDEAWINNVINNEAKHQRMTIIPAGKTYGTYNSSYGAYYPTNSQMQSMLFPGTKYVTELTNTSHTNYGGKLFNSNTDGFYYMDKPITNIYEDNGLISFTFMGGRYIAAPMAEDATNVGDGKLTANWDAVDGASSYTLELAPLSTDGETVLTEDMENFESYSTDQVIDISSMLNAYFKNEGWSGSKIYAAENSIKLGSSSTTGFLNSPLCDTPYTGTVTVTLNAKYYNQDKSYLKVILLDKNGYDVSAKEVNLTNTAADYKITFTDIASSYKIKIATPTANKLAYIYNISIYDGVPSKAQTSSNDSKLTVTGISGTSYTFSDLTEDAYRYHVKAINGDAYSDWSDYIKVEGVAPTAISEIQTSDDQTQYFTINGARVSRPTASGIYLVKKGDKVLKMLINR